MAEHLTPLRVAIALIGPVALIAEICGLDESTPHMWKRGSKLQDPWDVPSARHMRKLLEYSRQRGRGLQPGHLIEGASTSEIAAILARREAESLEAAQ